MFLCHQVTIKDKGPETSLIAPRFIAPRFNTPWSIYHLSLFFLFLVFLFFLSYLFPSTAFPWEFSGLRSTWNARWNPRRIDLRARRFNDVPYMHYSTIARIVTYSQEICIRICTTRSNGIDVTRFMIRTWRQNFFQKNKKNYAHRNIERAKKIQVYTGGKLRTKM